MSQKAPTSILFIIAGGIFVLLVGMAAGAHFSGIVEYPDKLNLKNFDWAGISAVAAFLTFLLNFLLILSVVAGFQTVKEGQASRSAEVLAWAAQHMDAVKADERKIRQAADDHTFWDEEVRAAATRVSHAYQRMSYYALNQLIDERHFRAMWGINLVVHWVRLKPFIESERIASGDRRTAAEGAYLRAHFEELAEKFLSYFKAHNPELIESYLRKAGSSAS
jgi:hypothetical protein